MRNIFFLILSCFCLLSVHAQNETSKDHISLAGIWNFKLDPLNISIPVKGSNFVSRFPEEITLPGSTDQAGKGFKTQDMSSLRLTRMFEYSGAAWYEKENIFIPVIIDKSNDVIDFDIDRHRIFCSKQNFKILLENLLCLSIMMKSKIFMFPSSFVT